MSVNGTTSQAIRKSPSGPLSDVQLPIYGTNLLTTASTHALNVGSLGDAAVADGQGEVEIPEAGVLRRLVLQNVIPGGTASFSITANVLKRSGVGGTPVQIPGATATFTNEDTGPVEIDINEPVHGPIAAADAAAAGFTAGIAVPADMIQVQLVVAAFGGGTSPVIRTELLWTPGATA